jgi:hypothetical protein
LKDSNYMRIPKALSCSLLFVITALGSQGALVFSFDSPTIKWATPACYPGTFGSFPQAGDCWADKGDTVGFSGTLQNTGTEDVTVVGVHAGFSFVGGGNFESDDFFRNPSFYPDPGAWTRAYSTYDGPYQSYSFEPRSSFDLSMLWLGYTATIGGLGIDIPAGATVSFTPFIVQFTGDTHYGRTGAEKLTLSFDGISPSRWQISESDSVNFGFVPEPGTTALFASGLLAIVVRYRRRSS